MSAFILADVPDKPTVVPWKVIANSDSTSLDIMIQPFTPSQNGGSMITSYQIQLDDGNAGPYTIVLG